MPRIFVSCLQKMQSLPLPVLATDMLMLTKLAGANPLGPGPRAVDQALGGLLTELIARNSFGGELGRYIEADLKKSQTRKLQGHVALMGLGERTCFDDLALRLVFKLFLTQALRHRIRHAFIPIVIRGLPRGRLTYGQAGQALRLALADLSDKVQRSSLEEIEVVVRTPQAGQRLSRALIA